MSHMKSFKKLEVYSAWGWVAQYHSNANATWREYLGE